MMFKTARLSAAISLLTILVALGGCSSVGLSAPEPSTPVDESSNESPTPATSTPAEESSPEEPANAASNSAAMLLLAQSETLSDEGKTPQAIALLERAIRLEPSNGDLWIQLGRLNLEENEIARAEQYAQRGISIAPAKSATRRNGWLLLADVSEARGDIEGAAQIRARWLNARG